METNRFRKAIEAFDAIHRRDPEKISAGGSEVTKSLLYHERLTYWVGRLAEEPSEVLLLAARCQHLQRKAIPRNQYPMDRAGYLKWRRALADFHVQKATEVLHTVGYPKKVTERVGCLLKKKSLKLDSEVQLFEDAICLVFLEIDLPEFSKKHTETKMLGILQRTWKKMSPNGHRFALGLLKELPRELQALLQSIQEPASV